MHDLWVLQTTVDFGAPTKAALTAVACAVWYPRDLDAADIIDLTDPTSVSLQFAAAPEQAWLVVKADVVDTVSSSGPPAVLPGAVAPGFPGSTSPTPPVPAALVSVVSMIPSYKNSFI